MKKIFLLLLAAFFVLSCKNTDDDDLQTNSYVGTWDWTSTTGGINGTTTTPASTGKTASITFTNDNKYIITENGKTVNEGTYSLYKETTSTDHMERVFIDFSNYEDMAVRNVTSTELRLYNDMKDGYEYLYTKAK